MNFYSRQRQTKQQSKGFTLLELLVVLVIMGIMLGSVTLTSMQNEKQMLTTEAQRVALLLSLAREEAIVRNRPTAFEANQQGYLFLELKNSRWERLSDVESLRAREFPFPAVQLTMIPDERKEAGQLRILFGREPVSKPFILHMKLGENQVAIQSDGVGHFTVE